MWQAVEGQRCILGLAVEIVSSCLDAEGFNSTGFLSALVLGALDSGAGVFYGRYYNWYVLGSRVGVHTRGA